MAVKTSFITIVVLLKLKVQLDWTSCVDTQKNNLPRGREGYDGFEYTDEKLSTKHIHWCGLKFYIFFF